MRGVVRRWLNAPQAPWLIVALGLLLMAPALTVDFSTDDHVHRVLSQPKPGIMGWASRPFDVFVFTTGAPEMNRELMNEGVFPWWTHPEAKLAFFRPLASFTHALDYTLWPDSAFAMQAHGLLWYALSLVMLWLAYRTFIPERWVAALGLLLYAVDDARGPTVGWIANRNATIALTLALPVLLAYHKGRAGDQKSAWFGPMLFAVALFAGESSLAIAAYLAAHALHLDRAPIKARIVALAPYALVVLAWRALYVALGYGVAGSGIYVDPGKTPLLFAEHAFFRMPVLLLSQLAAPWSDMAGLYPFLGPHGLLIATLASIAALVLLTYVFVPVLRDSAHARFFLTGTVLSAVPVCSTFPADRLLTFVGVGGMGLLACVLARAWTNLRSLAQTRVRMFVTGGVVAVLTLLHIVLSPPALFLRARSMDTVEKIVAKSERSLPRDPSLRDKIAILVNSPGDPFLGYLQITRASRGIPRPAALRWLATGLTPVAVERLDEYTLRVTPEGGFLQFDMDRMLRDPRDPFRPGDVVELQHMRVTIEAVTDDGRPLAVRVTFDRPLEDASFVWLRWEGQGIVPYTPPSVGERHVLPPIDMLEVLKTEA